MKRGLNQQLNHEEHLLLPAADLPWTRMLTAGADLTPVKPIVSL